MLATPKTKPLFFLSLAQRFVVCIFILTFNSCVLGPNYSEPEIKTPENWDAARYLPVKQDPLILKEWWKTFNDTVLNELIDIATTNKDQESNLSLQIAAARIREARANYNAISAGLFPSLDLSTSIARRDQSGFQSSNTNTSINPSPQNSFQLGFDSVWELDIFGGTRRSIEASTANIQALQAELSDVLITLSAEVALNYVTFRELEERLRIAHANIAAQLDSFGLTQARFSAGLVSELDVTEARAQLASTKAQVPDIEVAQAKAINRLSTLLGTDTKKIKLILENPNNSRNMPEVETLTVPILPSELLRRRPDIRKAERELAAATAAIGVATANLFPKFSLGGSIQLQNSELDDLIDARSKAWSIVQGITIPVFNAGRLNAQLKATEERQTQALLNYKQSILLAIEEVENAINIHTKEKLRLNALTESVNANRRSTELARELYVQGLADFLRVLESQRSLFASEQALAQSRASITTSLIALYKSLGGGWDPDTPTAE